MAEEKAAEKPSEPAAAASSGGAGAKLLPILTIVNLVVTVGMLAILFLSFQRDKSRQTVADIDVNSGSEEGGGGGHGAPAGGHGGGEAKGAKKTSAHVGKIINLDQFTVNLAAAGSVNPKYVRVNISLEVANDEAEAELNQKMAQVRNTVIDLFNSKKPADLATVEGREYLKDEIKNALNGFLVGGKVKAVFFTNFAISS